VTEHITSNTAQVVAVLRAAHLLLDAPPRILDDRVVLDLLPRSATEHVHAHPETFQSPAARALRSHVVVRSRFAEDRLADAFRRGVRQYVVLGAGYDSFAFRQPDWAGEVRIFEVDQPATQAAKRERLASAGIAVPDNVRLVPIDFEADTLAEGLSRGGVSLDQPVFFSWLGVTLYLTTDAVEATFRLVAGLPASSEIVFTFAQPLTGARDESALADMAARAAEGGEPWITFYHPHEMADLLGGMGFSRVEFLTPEETEARYFQGRTDELPVPRRVSIAAAVR